MSILTVRGEKPYARRDPVLKALERTKWSQWHGYVFRALQEIESITMELDAETAETHNGTMQKLLRAIEEFQTYIERNAVVILNYGEQWRSGE